MISIFRLRIFWFLILSTISIFTMFSATISVSFFRNIIFDSSNVFRNLAGRSAIWFENISKTLETRKAIQIENENLRKKIKEYEEHLKLINSLAFENETLRNILEFSLSVDYNLLSAQIIAINGEGNNIQSVLIDKGSTRGIQKNMAVVGIHNNNLVVVGSVSHATFYTAQFIPITHVNFSVPAQTQQSMQKGILSGYNGQENLLLFTSDAIYDGNSDFIFVGEEVIINAYSQFFPRGMLIGVVIKVSSGVEDRISRSYVRPYIKPSNLDYVFIVISKKKDDSNKIFSDDAPENETDPSSTPGSMQ